MRRLERHPNVSFATSPRRDNLTEETQPASKRKHSSVQRLHFPRPVLCSHPSTGSPLHQPTSRAVTRCQPSRALPISKTRSCFPTIDRPKKRRKSRLNPIVPAKQRRAPRGLRSTNWEIGSLPCPTQYHRNTRAVPVKQVSCSPPRPTQKVEPAAGLPDRLLLPLVAVLRYTSSATPTPRCAALYFPDCMEHESNRRILRARLGWCAVWETILAGTQQRDPA